MSITESDIKRIKYYSKHKPDYNKWYGMKKGLYSYLRLPQLIPLKAHLQHGTAIIYRNNIPDPLVLNSKFKNVFLCNSYQKQICNKYLSKKDIYIIGSIYPLFRQNSGIFQNTDASGTLFYPAHSTEKIRAVENIEKTLEILKKLPDYLKPIKISIYYKDLLQGLNIPYENNGYETVTNGHRNDQSFINNFYETLKSVKYTMGTTLGSHTYCAVEMGIPYFIIGDIPNYINEGNDYVPAGTFNGENIAQLGYLKHIQARSLFIKTDFRSSLEITKEQKEFVMNSIGYYEKISSAHLKRIILKSLINK